MPERNAIQKIRQQVQAFESKYLRISIVEEESLEFSADQRWTNNYKNLRHSKLQQKSDLVSPSLQLTQQSNFYKLLMMVFPQINTQTPIDIDILDTMFFMQDHSICYVYRDLRRGLFKIKQRGIHACQSFFKRKSKKRQVTARDKGFNKTKSSIFLGEQKSQKYLSTNMDYFALLKYKDGSFLRLKQSDLRSIFTNPLYANQKFHHNNCTQYIQILPSQNAQEMRIHFNWNKFKDDPLMEAARQSQLGKIGIFGERQCLKSTLQRLNPIILLHYIVFQICAYVVIHYNKQIVSAHFHFVCEDDTWSLAGVEGLRIAAHSQNQFVRMQLWQNRQVHFGKKESRQATIFQERPEESSLLLKSIQNYFSNTNQTIKKGVAEFIKTKVDQVKKVQDRKLSKAIFQILHPGEGDRFYQYLNSPQKLSKTVSSSFQKRKYYKSQLNVTKPSQPANSRPKRSLLQQMMRRQQQKQQYVYRGLQS